MTTEPDETYRAEVAPEWIDYNGHMNVAYYVLAFDRAADLLFARIGIDEAYRRSTNHSFFALEAHVTYERELHAGEAFTIVSRAIDADAKRLHLFHTMSKAATAEVAATMEVMCLHVDLAGPRAAPMPYAIFAGIEARLAASRLLPVPPQLGHKIGIRRG
jgi:acyl-CoA thioester hydrolase